MINLKFEKAKEENVQDIVGLLIEDDLGSKRESLSEESFSKYQKSFEAINNDKNQFLFIVKDEGEVIGTYHLTIMPSMTFEGMVRLNIEAVRVKASYRSQGIGEAMMNYAISFAKQNNCGIIQLATNKLRIDAIRFYEKCGFEKSHEGMKIVL